MSATVKFAAFAALALAAGLPAPEAAAQAGGRVGVLACRVSGGVGFVITSSKALNCAFRPTRGRPEYYVGTVRRFGLDVGFSGPGELRWAVVAPSRPGPGALAGDYVGASAEVTPGAGVGANALVGGLNNSLSLQPLSVSAQTGVALAAGVGSMALESAPPPRRRR